MLTCSRQKLTVWQEKLFFEEKKHTWPIFCCTNRDYMTLEGPGRQPIDLRATFGVPLKTLMYNGSIELCGRSVASNFSAQYFNTFLVMLHGKWWKVKSAILIVWLIFVLNSVVCNKYKYNIKCLTPFTNLRPLWNWGVLWTQMAPLAETSSYLVLNHYVILLVLTPLWPPRIEEGRFELFRKSVRDVEVVPSL